jgi:erythromycin esterase
MRDPSTSPRFFVRTLLLLPFLASLALAACGDAVLAGAPAEVASPRLERGEDRLLTGAEMETAEDPLAPPENEEWARWAAENAHPIRSLTSGEFADLRFLNGLLKGKRIVQLGESGHGVSEFSTAKVRLIKYLHQEQGYDVVAMESGLFECHWVNGQVRFIPPVFAMRNCMFGVWQVKEVEELFAYMAQTHATDRPLQLAGFDTQFSSVLIRARPSFLRSLIAPLDTAYASLAARTDSVFVARMTGPFAARAPYLRENQERLNAFYTGLEEYLDRNRTALARGSALIDGYVLATRQSVHSTPTLIRQSLLPPVEQNAVRDLGMADNLDFLLDEMYPGKKVIVWAHNVHVSHGSNVYPARQFWMGSHVAERRRAELYTIGLYSYRGRQRDNAGNVYTVRSPMPAGSLESILYRARKRQLFVDLSRQERTPGTEWMFVPTAAHAWGVRPEPQVLRDQYDGILFVDTTNPPTQVF